MKMTSKLRTSSKLKTTPKMTPPQQYYLKKLVATFHLDRHSKTDFKPEILSAVSIGNRIWYDESNVRGVGHAHDFLGKDMMRIFVKLSIVKTVKEVLAVCRSSLDEVVIFKLRLWALIPRSVGPSVGLSVGWSVSPLKITTNYKNMGVIWARYNWEIAYILLMCGWNMVKHSKLRTFKGEESEVSVRVFYTLHNIT